MVENLIGIPNYDNQFNCDNNKVTEINRYAYEIFNHMQLHILLAQLIDLTETISEQFSNTL